jgi:hypothetical protein
MNAQQFNDIAIGTPVIVYSFGIHYARIAGKRPTVTIQGRTFTADDWLKVAITAPDGTTREWRAMRVKGLPGPGEPGGWKRAVPRASRPSAPGDSHMPVYTRIDRDGDPRLTLSNGDEVLDVQHAAAPHEASRVAIMMLASRDVFNHGDTLTVRNAVEASHPLAPA